MSAKTAFRLAWERRLERDSADDVVMDVLELAMGELAGDELDVIGRCIERLKKGRETYGPLRLDGDTRDWPAERRDEDSDSLVYSLIWDMSREARREEQAKRPARRIVGDFELVDAE